MRKRMAGVAVLTATIALGTAASAPAKGLCDEGTVNPATVSQPLHALASATGLSALNGIVNPIVGGVEKVDGQVKASGICKTAGL